MFFYSAMNAKHFLLKLPFKTSFFLIAVTTHHFIEALVPSGLDFD